MKKLTKALICTILIFAFALTVFGCDANDTSSNNASSDQAQSAPSEGPSGENSNHESAPDSSVSSITDFQPDKERLQKLAIAAASVNWPAISGVSWSEYTGFEESTEISSDGLFNFFLNHADPDEYFDVETKTYCFSADDVCEVLSKYFVEFDFDPSKITNDSWMPDDKGKYALKGFYGSDVSKLSYRIDEWAFEETTNLLTVKGREMDLDDRTKPTGTTFVMQVLVDGDSYLIKRHLIFRETLN